jgi:hypothetical protein
MIGQETCANCKFGKKDEEKRTRCRRFPPHVTSHPLENPNKPGEIVPFELANFPVVFPSWWCGEWRTAIIQ